LSVKVGCATIVSATCVEVVKLPEVPVTMIVAGPTVALELAVTVKTLEFAIIVLKDAVVPAGRPDADRLTVPLKPFCGAMVMVVVPLVPCTMFKPLDEASVKLGGAETVTVITVFLVKVPEVPVIVAVNDARVAALVAEKVRVLAVFVLVGLKEAVTPFGKPDAVRLTEPVKALKGTTLTVVAAVPPWGTAILLAVVDRVKLGLEPGQLFTRFAAFNVPMPVAKSHPGVAG
jgi:hypothetical protein